MCNLIIFCEYLFSSLNSNGLGKNRYYPKEKERGGWKERKGLIFSFKNYVKIFNFLLFTNIFLNY